MQGGSARIVRNGLTVVLLSLIVILLVCLVGYAINVFLVVFVAILFAVFLRGLSCWLSSHSPISPKWALLSVVVLIAAVLGLTSWLLADPIGAQMTSLASELPQAAAQLEAQIRKYDLGRQLLGTGPGLEDLVASVPNTFSKAGLFVTSSIGVLVNMIVVLFVGLYLAANPRLYLDGVLKLLPGSKQKRGREVLEVLTQTLQRWLFGRLILMVGNGVITAVGLALLGVPLAVPLGIIAGLLNFIPNLGPIIAAVPALLIAWIQSPTLALYVLLFYIGYQMLDGYVLTPLVEKHTVSMPPALTIVAQLLLGVLIGSMGVLVAVPLLAVVLVLVKMLYLQDVLAKRVKLPGHG